MSALGSFVRGIALCAASALGLGGPAGHGERQGSVSADAGASPAGRSAPTSERDLRDRERELRILMSNWM